MGVATRAFPEPRAVTVARFVVMWPWIALIGKLPVSSTGALILMVAALALVHGHQVVSGFEDGETPFRRRPLFPADDDVRSLGVWGGIATGLVIYFSIGPTQYSVLSPPADPTSWADVVALVGVLGAVAASVALLLAAFRLLRATIVEVPAEPDASPIATLTDGTRLTLAGAEGFSGRAGQTLTVLAAHDAADPARGPYRGAGRAIHIDAVYEGPPARARATLRKYAGRWALAALAGAAMHWAWLAGPG